MKGRIIDLYLDWNDSNTFVGKGKILEVLDSKPIVEVGGRYYIPRRCLVEISSSHCYREGFQKHFIHLFPATEKQAEKLLKIESKEVGTKKIGLLEDIQMRNDPITSNPEDLELFEMSIGWTYIPPVLYKKVLQLKRKADEFR